MMKSFKIFTLHKIWLQW